MTIPEYYILPPMPEGLQGLAELALDLRWSWSHKSDVIWEKIDSDLWEITRNPWLILQSATQNRLQALKENKSFINELKKQVELHKKYLQDTSWFSQKYKKSSVTIAYLSMEFGLSESLPIYSGGLGILAGDVLKTASDLDVPVIGIGLLYQQGYFRQVINSEGKQIEYYPYNDPSQLPVLPVRDKDGRWQHVNVQFPGRVVKLRVWQANVGRVKLYLLDSNEPENGPADQCITAELYGGGKEMRLQQEMVLGIGGWKLIHDLGINTQVCHLNEGHAALAVIERARIFAQEMKLPFKVALEATKAGNVFTTHTPVAAGFDRFDPSLVYQYLKGYADRIDIGIEGLLDLGRENPGDTSEPLNMAYLAVRGSSLVNAVSRLHGQVSRSIFSNLFPRWPQEEVPVTHVTNGVHVPSWDSEISDDLWTNACGKDRWIGTLDNIEDYLKKVPDDTLWNARNKERANLVDYARERLVRQLEASGASHEKIVHAREILDPKAFTIGFARRFAEYKRPNLLIHNPERLRALLCNNERPVQIIIAGKAHPHDNRGKAMIAAWTNFIRQSNARSHVVFLADYDMSLAEHMVQGVDLWINNPRRPWEASGTSGMKVLVNGGLNLSELDGWWAEAYKPEVGWALGDRCEHGNDLSYDACEADQLYRLLEQEIVPLFYERNDKGIPAGWVSKIRSSMAELTPQFSSNRMLREYVEKLYLPSHAAFMERTEKKASKSKSIYKLKNTIRENFSKIYFGESEISSKDDKHYYKVPVFLEGIKPGEIAVQLYAESLNGDGPEIHNMICGEMVADKQKGYFFNIEIPAKREIKDYTPRVVPVFNGEVRPIESNQILWKQ